MLSYRTRFEGGVISFDLEDDMEFCPNLLTECDEKIPCTGSAGAPLHQNGPGLTKAPKVASIASSASERSSLASNSLRVAHTTANNDCASLFSQLLLPTLCPSDLPKPQLCELHQPRPPALVMLFPIINPATGITDVNAPPSVSPARMVSNSQSSGRW